LVECTRRPFFFYFQCQCIWLSTTTASVAKHPMIESDLFQKGSFLLRNHRIGFVSISTCANCFFHTGALFTNRRTVQRTLIMRCEAASRHSTKTGSGTGNCCCLPGSHRRQHRDSRHSTDTRASSCCASHSSSLSTLLHSTPSPLPRDLSQSRVEYQEQSKDAQ
jgi:hypothetical protein